MKNKMPRRKSLFWDTDANRIDKKKHAEYIIERILDFGTDKEIRWMWHTYPRALIAKVLNSSRVLRGKTKALWRLLVAE